MIVTFVELNKLCTATLIELKKLPGLAKTAPPTFDAGHGITGLHRDNFPGLTGQGPGRLLSQVTFTHPIAVPLAQMDHTQVDN